MGHAYRGAAAAARRSRGFTLTELIIIIVLLGVVTSYALSKAMPQASQATLGYQASMLADDLRQTQMLAMSWGKPLRFTPSSGSYAVTCVAVSVAPCTSTSTAVYDIGHAGSFSVTLANGVTLSGSSVDFDIVGKPSAARTFTLTGGGQTRTVTVAAGTGYVAVN
jgi:prepilin-type N-terminal cleavage/methylation domain-containing protein